MKCDKIKELLSAYLDNELTEKEETKVRRHLEDCIDCKEEALELDKILKMVNQAPKLKAPPTLAQAVNEGIAQASQEEENIFLRYRWTIPAIASAAAAFLVVYVGLVIFPKHVPTTDYSNKTHEPAQPAHEKEPKPSGSLLKEELKKSPKKRGDGYLGKYSADKDNVNPQTATISRKENKDRLAKSKKSKRQLTYDHKKSESTPVAFSQQVMIACKDNNTAVKQIVNIQNQLTQGQGGKSYGQDDSLESGQSLLSGNQAKSKDKINEIRIVLPLNQKEAFIEQLKTQKIGEITVVNLETTKTGSLTVNKLLEKEVLDKVTENLDIEVAQLKEEDKRGFGKTRSKRSFAKGDDAPKDEVTPAPEASKTKMAEKQSNNKKEQLEQIDKSLIILHDLKQQKEVENKLGRSLDSESEKGLAMNRKTKTTQQAPGSPDLTSQKDSELPLIELIIILNDN